MSEESCVAFMCDTDYRHELHGASDGARIFSSLDDLKEHSPCVGNGCGFVEVRLTVVRHQSAEGARL